MNMDTQILKEQLESQMDQLIEQMINNTMALLHGEITIKINEDRAKQLKEEYLKLQTQYNKINMEDNLNKITQMEQIQITRSNDIIREQANSAIKLIINLSNIIIDYKNKYHLNKLQINQIKSTLSELSDYKIELEAIYNSPTISEDASNYIKLIIENTKHLSTEYSKQAN